MIEVKVNGDYSADGIAIWVSRRWDGQPRQVLHVTGGAQSWDDTEPSQETPPTLHLEDDAGRALLDALLAYYHGTADLHTARSDLLHERGRADHLIAVITDIAACLARNPQPPPATRARP